MIGFSRRNQIAPKFQALAAGKSILSYADTNLGEVIATEAGLIGRNFQLDWQQMFQASFNPPELAISYHSDAGNKTMQLRLDPANMDSEFANLIRAKITTNVIAQSRIEYQPEQYVIISARRKNATEIKFVISADAEIDVKSAEFKSWAEQELAEFKETFGFSNF